MDIVLFFCLILIPISIYQGLSKIADAIKSHKGEESFKDFFGRSKKAQVIKKELDLDEILSQ